MQAAHGPLVTIGIVSCNRLHYLKALIESARECIRYEPIEWIIVDNASIEPGLREYLESLEFVQQKIFRAQRRPSTEHLEAMNAIIERSHAECVMILPEDAQFIIQGAWMADFVALVQGDPGVGTVSFDAQRRATIAKFFGASQGPARWLPAHRRRRRRWTSSGAEFIGYGRSKPGIAGAGILSFGRTELWRRLGPWKACGKQTVADSTGGGEREMLQRLAGSRLHLERVLTRIPVCAALVTDPVGTRARVRGNRRYGRYAPPPEGRFYYRIWDETDLAGLGAGELPIAFEEIVRPMQFELPVDAQGRLLKNPHVRHEDPFEWLDPSVVGQDIS